MFFYLVFHLVCCIFATVIVCHFLCSLMAFDCQEIKGLLTYLLTYYYYDESTLWCCVTMWIVDSCVGRQQCNACVQITGDLLCVMYVDQLMYWVSIRVPTSLDGKVEMASLNGTGRVTLLNESQSRYSCMTLYDNFLYICDNYRRLASCMYTVLPLKTIIMTRYAFANDSSLYALDQHRQ